MVRRTLLFCGIAAMLWYIILNIIVPARYPGYDMVTQTVSELSAIDSPTRSLWFILCIFYSLLFFVFGIGVWLSADGSRKLRVVGAVIVFDALIGSFWPPMHQREVIAAGGGSLTDTLHLVWTFIHLCLMLVMIGFGAAAFGKPFRILSVAVVLIFIIFGMLTAKESFGIEAGTPTPHVGLWERINMGAYMLWVIVFAVMLLRKPDSSTQRGSSNKSLIERTPAELKKVSPQ